MTDLYFAYGSNLDSTDWAAWCARQGHDPDCIRPVGPATLPDAELVFDYHSTSRGGGALNLSTRPGQCVDGILFRVSPAGWRALDRKEGAPRAYVRRTRTAILPGGTCVQAATYEVVPDRREGFVAPTPDYLDICLRGRRAHGLGTRMLERAASGAAAEPEVDGIFVYGTLMRGEYRFPALQAAGLRAIAPATARGRLLDLGAFPGLVPDGTGPVRGELAVPADPGRALERLDVIEGAEPRGGGGGLYRRTLLPVASGEGGARLAWTYVLGAAAPAGCARIPAGCWRTHAAHEE